MAEIRIRKKKSLVWLWVLVILAVLAIIVWLFTANKISLSQYRQTEGIQSLKQTVALRQKSITQVPGIISLKLETYIT